MRVRVIRTALPVSPSDHCRLEALVRDRNSAQKHVWRARIVLLIRYDVDRKVTGTIAPDPDGAGPLPLPAVRDRYDAAGRLIQV